MTIVSKSMSESLVQLSVHCLSCGLSASCGSMSMESLSIGVPMPSRLAGSSCTATKDHFLAIRVRPLSGSPGAQVVLLHAAIHIEEGLFMITLDMGAA